MANLFINIPGEGIQTVVNTGSGDVLTTVNGTTLSVKTLIAGSGITLTPTGNDITISAGGGGSGITSLNGLVAASQFLTIGTSGTSPSWSDVTATHTLNIPLASVVGVTAGLISYSQFNSFATNSFTIFQTDSGTFPTASSNSDTLTLTNTDGEISISGNSGTKTVTFGLNTVTTAKGGTGLTSPGSSGNILTSNGTIWTSAPPATNGTVTNVSVVTANGISGSVATSTTTPAITLTLGDITPNSVAAVSTVTGSNLSGTNTGDQTITLTGDITGSGTGSFATTLATVNASPGTYNYATLTVNAKGLVTSASSGAAPTGTVTSVSVVSANGFAGTVATATTTPAITLSTSVTGILYGNGTSVAAAIAANFPILNQNTTGTASNITATSNSTLTTLSALSLPTSQLTGSISAAQMLALPTNDIYVGNGSNLPAAVAMSGDATIVSTGALTLSTVNSNVGAFGTASSVGSFTVNAKGLTTAASNISIQIAESQVTNLVSDLAGKQPTGNYITALTGDATASGPGSVALTLATVNSNVGSFGSSTSIPSFTVNAKGLITAASGNAVIAPAGTLTGTTLASNVVSSSLTSVGTITSGTWNGTTIDVTHGGTSLTTLTANNVILGNGTSAPTFVAPGTSGNLLTSNGTTWTSAAPATNGTVTSVALSTPGVLYTVSGSPITTSGTLTLNLVSQNANTVFAGPTSGAAAAPTFRAQVLADLPVASGQSFLTSGTTYTTPATINTNTTFKFTLIGGGGGSGGANAANVRSPGGGGGGGGIVYLTGLSPSTAYTIAIGAGGTAGTATTNGGNGGNTTLTVGATTYTAFGGNGGVAGASNYGGIGGGTFNCTLGANGQWGGSVSAAAATDISGQGGASGFGFGAGGQGTGPNTFFGPALPGILYGGGAGGASDVGAGVSGAAGAAGCILVEWRV